MEDDVVQDGPRTLPASLAWIDGAAEHHHQIGLEVVEEEEQHQVECGQVHGVAFLVPESRGTVTFCNDQEGEEEEACQDGGRAEEAC